MSPFRVCAKDLLQHTESSQLPLKSKEAEGNQHLAGGIHHFGESNPTVLMTIMTPLLTVGNMQTASMPFILSLMFVVSWLQIPGKDI